ncbi:MAG: hypothetical protein ACPLW7_00245 [Minisyncoccia bacterium]|jgi:hypothetical protein
MDLNDEYNEYDPLKPQNLLKLSLYQMDIISEVIKNLDNEKENYVWIYDLSEIINKVFESYYIFQIYKILLNEILLDWIFFDDEDDGVIYSRDGIPVDELISLMGYPEKKKVLEDLTKIDVIDIKNDRIFPGNIIKRLIEIKKVFKDEFSNQNWKKNFNLALTFVIINISKEYIINSQDKKNRVPQVIIASFNILSYVIYEYFNIKNYKSSEAENLYKISYFIVEKIFRQSAINRRRIYRYVGFLLGTFDGEAKIFEDVDSEKNELILNSKLNRYIEFMIERIRIKIREQERT